MDRESHRDNIEGNGYPAHRKHNVHSSCFRALKDNNHCQFEQTNKRVGKMYAFEAGAHLYAATINP